MTSASVFLRRLALPTASKGSQQQLRLASSVGVASALPSSSSAPSGATTRGGNIGSRRGMATISAGDALARLATDHPHQEIIRYEHKNVKWTLKHVNYYSDALACGLVDAGLQPGDVVLSWLPMHFAEQVSYGQTVMICKYCDLCYRLGRCICLGGKLVEQCVVVCVRFFCVDGVFTAVHLLLH